MKTSIWWIRRDLRLNDNQALTNSLRESEAVIPLFIIDPVFDRSRYVGSKRLAFLHEGLRSLDAALRKRGSYLVIRRGNPNAVIPSLIHETGAQQVWAEADVSPYARIRDKRVMESAPMTLVSGLTVYPPDAVLKANGKPYTVFTPFSRAWKVISQPDSHSILPVPEVIRTPGHIHSLPIPVGTEGISLPHFPAGEAEALRRLQRFSEHGIYEYGERRDFMHQDATSRLSPYLRFGMLSARQAAVAALQAASAASNQTARKGAETWLNELIWREFYMMLLFHYPHARTESFRQELRGIKWENNPTAFAAWREGRTGYPIVDAAMRQLAALGWMHNRARMIVASFLTKDLLIDWRWGEEYFMQQLIDGDPASNNGGWQWTAGTGSDAAPYFRIFNPILQGAKYDPQGEYIRQWVTELRNVPTPFIHQPWTMPAAIQQASQCLIGKDYPLPIVDHVWARQRTLAAYRSSMSL